jgi:hypothetical protein
MRMRAAGLAACVLLFAGAAQAQMYKCVDERGRMTYSDKPQPGCKGGKVDIQPIPSISGQGARSQDDAPSSSRSTAQQDADFRRRMYEREQREATEKQARDEQCAKVRQELHWLSATVRMATINDAGERVFMDEATREKRISELKQQSRGCP